jgi:hypothetical protein
VAGGSSAAKISRGGRGRENRKQKEDQKRRRQRNIEKRQ